MKRKNTRYNAFLYIGALVLVFLAAFLGSFVTRSFAASTDQVIIDDQAGLLEGTQTTSLLVRANETAKTTGWDLRLVTTDDTGGRTAQEYAEDYFMDHYSSNNGITYLIDMDNREIYIATSGDAIYYLTDERIDAILDSAYTYVKEENYGDAFRAMLNQTATFYSSGIDENTYTFDRDTGKIVYYKKPKSITAFEGILGVIAGALAALGLGAGVNGRYKMKTGNYRYSISGNHEVDLQIRRDTLVNRFVTSRNLPKNPPPSSGGHGGGGHQSTVHSGSGGHSFGGGGRKF